MSLDFFGTFWVKPKSTEKTILNYNYTYDNKGLMASRTDSVMKRWEDFTYDNLDRLIQVSVGNLGQPGIAQTFNYSGNGNMEINSAVGTYTYNSWDKPHAVMEIEPLDSAVISKNQCDVTYNFFNQPVEITEGDYKLEISYGANRQRNKAVRYRNDTLENTRYYINKHYEKEIDHTTGTIRHYNYIYGDNGVVALNIFNETTGTSNMYYIHTDHLGSYIALTNNAGKIFQRNCFDIWGNPIPVHKVDTAGGVCDSTLINFTLTNRGFTGHEHYPFFKIINMNGRLYDPVIARFFSPDKYVANSSFTQDFNRYTYARNNPLMYTDPDGENPLVIALVAIGISAIMSATSYTISVATSPGGFQNWNWSDFGANMMIGIGQGILTSAIGGAFSSIATTNILGSIGVEIGRAGAHAAVGGLFSYIQGDNFWMGAAASGFSSLMGSATAGLPWWAQIGASTITGGAVSKMTGGTFWEGAVNGFLVSVLNHACHPVEGDPSKSKDKLKENTQKGTFISGLATGLAGGAAENTIIEAAGELGVSVKEFVKILKAASGGEAQALKVINGLKCGTKILGVLGGTANLVISGIEAYNDRTPGNIIKVVVQGAIIGTACIPGIGWAISLGLSIADYAAGDYIYRLIDGKK